MVDLTKDDMDALWPLADGMAVGCTYEDRTVWLWLNDKLVLSMTPVEAAEIGEMLTKYASMV